MGTMSRVNFSDALKRVAMVLHQHIMKIERRYETRTETTENSGLFHTAKLELFSESAYATASYRCATVSVASVPGCVVFQKREVKKKMNIPESKVRPANTSGRTSIRGVANTPPLPPSRSTLASPLGDIRLHALAVQEGAAQLRVLRGVPHLRGEAHGEGERAAHGQDVEADRSVRTTPGQ